MSKIWTFFAAATFMATSLATPAFSAEERYAGDVVQIVPDGKVFNVTLSIAGPGGYYAQAFAKAGMPMIKLSQHGPVADGLYIWQVTAATDELIEVRDKGLRSGSTKPSGYRRASPGMIRINKGTAESGSFRVQNGSILPKSDATEEKSEQQNVQ